MNKCESEVLDEQQTRIPPLWVTLCNDAFRTEKNAVPNPGVIPTALMQKNKQIINNCCNFFTSIATQQKFS